MAPQLVSKRALEQQVLLRLNRIAPVTHSVTGCVGSKYKETKTASEPAEDEKRAEVQVLKHRQQNFAQVFVCLGRTT